MAAALLPPLRKRSFADFSASEPNQTNREQQTQFLTGAAAAALKFPGAPESGDTDPITWLTSIAL